jgi:predicted RNA binding protein YcfA (HicA-like mRNA interferase family)
VARLPELPARRILAALERAGFREARRRGSHRFLVHDDGRTLVFAVHDRERVGPKLLAKILRDARLSHHEFKRLL